MLDITNELLCQIRLEAERAYPEECCGIIFGRIEGPVKYAQEIAASENSFEEGERHHRFRITAGQMLKAERYARSSGQDIVGFYHSHPDHPAIPSEYDRSHALPVYSYIIVSVMGGSSQELTCHELDPGASYGRFAPEEIITDQRS